MTNEEIALERLDAAIRQLEKDYRRYFVGDLPLPPEELENSIRNQVRQLRNTQLRRAADNFRLSSLEARFASYGEMYRRRLRDIEEGRVAPQRGSAVAPPTTAPKPPSYRREDGVVVGERAERGGVAELFADLKRAGGAGNFDVDGLATYLERQAEAIRTKTGRSQVQFRIVEEEGRVKLKARPLG